jgi:tight adherence protein B
MYSPLSFGLLLALCVLLLALGAWRSLEPRDPVDERLAEYGLGGGLASSAEGAAEARRGPAVRGIGRLLAGFGLGPGLARALARADLPMTAAEFAAVMLIAACTGFAIGFLRAGILLGLVVGLLFGYLPLLYLRSRGARRVSAFNAQLPDVLTLLVGGLRAGQGLSQAIAMIAGHVPDPAGKEFARIGRSVSLGFSLPWALNDMADRIGSDDLDLVVAAMNIQYEMGGNLATNLEIIGDTVRDRIRIKRDLRVFTAQQRMTGYVLAAMPLALAVILYLVNPGYMSGLWQPGMVIVPIVGAAMMVLGLVVILRILDVEV